MASPTVRGAMPWCVSNVRRSSARYVGIFGVGRITSLCDARGTRDLTLRSTDSSTRVDIRGSFVLRIYREDDGCRGRTTFQIGGAVASPR